MTKENWQRLPGCHQKADNLDIILVCDGAASVGQVGHEVGVKLTKVMPQEFRLCCLAAIAAGSKLHLELAQKAKKLIAINGCGNKCVTKILEQRGMKPTYEFNIVEEDVEKVPTLDFDEADVDRIATKIAQTIAKG